MDNITEQLKVTTALTPDEYAVGAVAGTAIDTAGHDEVILIVVAGVATGTLALKVQESSDNAVADSYADISGATFTTLTSSNDESVMVARVNCKATERYIKIVGTCATDVVYASAVAVLGKSDYTPNTNTLVFDV